jgi:hypothetical protein
VIDKNKQQLSPLLILINNNILKQMRDCKIVKHEVSCTFIQYILFLAKNLDISFVLLNISAKFLLHLECYLL